MKTLTMVKIMSFLAGFSIMAIELAGGRMLAPFFGSSIYVWGSLITVFMMSLAGGYYLGGKLSRKLNLKIYSMLFAISGILTFPIPLLSEPVIETLFYLTTDPRYGSIISSIILFAPGSVALGLIAPCSVRLATTSAQESGEKAGTLYFISTAGSAIGTIITSFYLVVIFNVSHIFYLMAAGLIAASVFILLSIKPNIQETESPVFVE